MESVKWRVECGKWSVESAVCSLIQQICFNSVFTVEMSDLRFAYDDVGAPPLCGCSKIMWKMPSMILKSFGSFPTSCYFMGALRIGGCQ